LSRWLLQVLPEKEARIVLAQIVAGLAYLNQPPHRIIHYDLKPANSALRGFVGRLRFLNLSGFCRCAEQRGVDLPA
jgi:serine/threonine protein kinase